MFLIGARPSASRAHSRSRGIGRAECRGTRGVHPISMLARLPSPAPFSQSHIPCPHPIPILHPIPDPAPPSPSYASRDGGMSSPSLWCGWWHYPHWRNSRNRLRTRRCDSRSRSRPEGDWERERDATVWLNCVCSPISARTRLGEGEGCDGLGRIAFAPLPPSSCSHRRLPGSTPSTASIASHH
ncbi:hypothetical protein FIBSPDRAFT_369799 [Athelia psychrophila]|uniref:Uncharacterized protein n=1 Tax=Athelia psychrophila TaxID=1759441 RepID=A0A167VH78_9AGAM|nr:hypothetical protein FIBSPDRAFT_369799 [Fibularhizoctonia sp. CBS 109695]